MTDAKPDLKEVIQLAIRAYLTHLFKNYQAGITPHDCKVLLLNKFGKDPKVHKSKVLITCLGEALAKFDETLKDPEAVKELKALSH